MKIYFLLIIAFLILMIGFWFFPKSTRILHINDTERSISNMKIIALRIRESPEKYDSLYLFYKKGLTGIMVFISPFTPIYMQEKVGQLEKLVIVEDKVLTEEQFDVICGYKYAFDKNLGIYIINDKYKPELNMQLNSR